MRARLLVLAAAVGSLAAPLSAQTTFFASGGNVVFTPAGMGFTPFQFYLDAIGNAHRLIASSDGTSFTLDTKGSVAIVSAGDLGSLTLGSFATGAPLIFTFVAGGRSYTTSDFYRQTTTGFNLDYADVIGNPGERFRFTLTGISSATGLECPGGDRFAVCSLLAPPVTPTPEPGTIALFATGLAGLIPVVVRRRRVSPS